MEEQKKLSVRDVLWRKKHARDKVLDAVGKLCEEAWAVVEKLANDRTSSAKDAAQARELGLRLRALGYLIEGEHYIDRIAFELRSKEVYLKTNEVSQAYVAEMVVSFLDTVIAYVTQSTWDDRDLRGPYTDALKQSLNAIRQSLVPEEEKQDDSKESLIK